MFFCRARGSDKVGTKAGQKSDICKDNRESPCDVYKRRGVYGVCETESVRLQGFIGALCFDSDNQTDMLGRRVTEERCYIGIAI